MKLVKQLSIFLKNSPGTLATVSEGMKDEGINILGLTVVDAVDHAVVRMVVDKPQKAIHFFGEHGLLVIDTDIVAVDLPNTAGALANLGRKPDACAIFARFKQDYPRATDLQKRRIEQERQKDGCS